MNYRTGPISTSLLEMSKMLDRRFKEMNALSRVTSHINSGVLLGEALDHVYDTFHQILPYDRLSLATIDESGERAHSAWVRAEKEPLFLKPGYSAPLESSSLATILKERSPRIINNLESYFKDHPESESSRLAIRDGIRSSLTCPLIVAKKPIGFLFFSSSKPHTYENAHIDLFLQLSGELSLLIEKTRLYQQLVELNKIKHQFIGMAVHDMRSPLTALRGYSKLLIEGTLGPLSPPQHDVVERIQRGVAHMIQILDELLDVSSIEAGHLDLKKEEVNLEDLLREIQAANQIIAKGKDIKLQMDIDYPLPYLTIDPNRIKEAFDNLINNAIKYSYPGSTVVIRANWTGQEVVFSIVDEGQGILKEDLPKLFKPFGKTSAHPTGGEPSTGLGLVIVKKIIDGHGGKIWVKSDAGRGSVFSFSLPAKS